MGAMAGSILPSLGRVGLDDLTSSEGLASDSYKMSVSALTHSFTQYSAAIIQISSNDGALLRAGLESARLFFNQRPYSCSGVDNTNDSREWCKTSGYYTVPHLWQEIFDYRPGLTSVESDNSVEFPPSGLTDMFSVLGKTARVILDAISFSLNMRSFSFLEILDNVPLRNSEVSSSVLSVCCHSRPSFQGATQHHNLTSDESQLAIVPDHEHQVDKSLITLIKPDRPGLHIKDLNGRWMLIDGDLSANEVVVYPGLALYQATAGYVNPALYRTEMGNMQGNIHGRFCLSFKLMPKPTSSLSCSEMRAAGHGVESHFQLPVPVQDFMQRSHSTDQLLTKQPSSDGSLKLLLKAKKSTPSRKPLPPSKRLRLEAQRVLKERVQDIADKKGIKLRFCCLKECEGHVQALDSPCLRIRTEIGWPIGVPFVHPHDLPNKAKLGFLETYEPGWMASQQDIESQSP